MKNSTRKKIIKPVLALLGSLFIYPASIENVDYIQTAPYPLESKKQSKIEEVVKQPSKKANLNKTNEIIENILTHNNLENIIFETSDRLIEKKIKTNFEENNKKNPKNVQTDKYIVLKEFKADVTAYNAGDPRQCNGNPCIAANNQNICKALEGGEKLCAYNKLPKDSLINIEGLGIYKVVDRTHTKYSHRIDIAMKKNELQKAKEFGIKKLNIQLLKEKPLIKGRKLVKNYD